MQRSTSSAELATSFLRQLDEQALSVRNLAVWEWILKVVITLLAECSGALRGSAELEHVLQMLASLRDKEEECFCPHEIDQVGVGVHRVVF